METTTTKEDELFGNAPAAPTVTQPKETAPTAAEKTIVHTPKPKRVNVSPEVARARLEKAKREIEAKEAALPKITLPQAYHPCSWCGGFKKSLVPLKPNNSSPTYDAELKEWEETVEALEDQVIIGQKIAVVGKAKPLIACQKCVGRVYNSVLGQARFHTQEMAHLTGEIPNTGYFPARK